MWLHVTSISSSSQKGRTADLICARDPQFVMAGTSVQAIVDDHSGDS